MPARTSTTRTTAGSAGRTSVTAPRRTRTSSPTDSATEEYFETPGGDPDTPLAKCCRDRTHHLMEKAALRREGNWS